MPFDQEDRGQRKHGLRDAFVRSLLKEGQGLERVLLDTLAAQVEQAEIVLGGIDARGDSLVVAGGRFLEVGIGAPAVIVTATEIVEICGILTSVGLSGQGTEFFTVGAGDDGVVGCIHQREISREACR